MEDRRRRRPQGERDNQMRRSQSGRHFRHRQRSNDRQQQPTADGSSADSGSRGRGRGRHPAGLKGKEIGLWYARQGKRNEHANRMRVTLDDQSVRNIEDVLELHRSTKPSAPSTSHRQDGRQLLPAWKSQDSYDVWPAQGSQSDSMQQRGIKSEPQSSGAYGGPSIQPSDHRPRVKMEVEEVKVKQEPEENTNEDESCQPNEETTADFMAEYTANLLENKNQGDEDIFVVDSCRHKSDEVKNRKLMEELEDMHRGDNSLQEFRKKLPSFQMKKDVLKVIEDNQVVVISGETGCGKTTQVTQFILDDAIQRGRGTTCKIICTQPRRISAISVAERVAEERGEQVGRSVGYSIRLSHVFPRESASITYCTTGILLRAFASDKQLTDFSHVIVDEVHERDIQTDFLLILLRDLLPRRPDLKVILMSATLNADHFSEYFYNAAMFNIPGFTFPVTEHYLEDFIDTLQYDCPDELEVNHNARRGRQNMEMMRKKEEEEAKLREWFQSHHCNVSRAGLLNILRMNHDVVHRELVAQLVRHICISQPEGAILVFLPGWSDINALNKQLKQTLSSVNVKIIPLHSLMPTCDQKDVFQRPPPAVRKIVLATNIAETSITIDDIVYVINCGKIKLTDYLSDRNINSLDCKWVSRANSRQRRGRAGRVQRGVCYHLYTRHHESLLQEYQKPEMVRTRLENVCLDVKLLGQGHVQPFLLKAMNPPSSQAIETSLNLLTKLNALDEEERLTPLGYHLARMPLDPHTGKMVLMAAMFSCLDPVLSIAACLNFKDPFHVPLNQQKEVDAVRKRLSRNTNSDLLMYYYTVKGWEETTNKSSYCRDNFISYSTITMISKMKGQFAELLHQLRFITSPQPLNAAANRNSGNMELVRAVLCAGLYPNVARVVGRGGRSARYPNASAKLSTPTERKVTIHQKSVNAGEDIKNRSQWVMYYEMLKLATGVYVMDTTTMPPFPIMFFGGKLNLELKGDGEQLPKYQAVVLNDWIHFQCEWTNAQLINKLREQLNEVLQSKISNPSPTDWNIKSKEGATLQAIVDLLSKERTDNSQAYRGAGSYQYHRPSSSR